MPVTFFLTCTDCGAQAPGIGDDGYLGVPSLEDAPRPGDLQTFGYLYAGLASLGLLSKEVETLRTFLEGHRGHSLSLSDSNGEAVEGMSTRGNEKPRDASTPPGRRRRKPPRDRFIEARYELTCATCRGVYDSNEAPLLRPFDPFSITKERYQTFRTHVLDSSEYNFERLPEFPFSDLDGIGDYLRSHVDHGVTARLIPVGVARERSPKRGRPTTPAVAPRSSWSPPEEHWSTSEYALGEIPGHDVWRLPIRLHDKDGVARAAAAQELGEMAHAAALGYLVPLLLDPCRLVRANTVRAIARLSDTRALRPLGRALLDEAEEVRTTAQQALRDIGVAAPQALSAARAPRVMHLVLGSEMEELSATDDARWHPHVMTRYQKVERLAADNTCSAESLLWALGDPHVLVRSRATELLGKCVAGPHTAEALLMMTRDGSGLVTHKAIEVLGRLRLPQAVPVLRSLLLGATARGTNAFDALGRIGTEAALEAIAEALNHSSPQVRERAAWTLGELKPHFAIERLSAAAKDADPAFRSVIRIVLEQLRPKRVDHKGGPKR